MENKKILRSSCIGLAKSLFMAQGQLLVTTLICGTLIISIMKQRSLVLRSSLLLSPWVLQQLLWPLLKRNQLSYYPPLALLWRLASYHSFSSLPSL